MKTRRNNYNFSSKYKCEEEEETEELETREVKAEGNNIYLYSDSDLSNILSLEYSKYDFNNLFSNIEYSILNEWKIKNRIQNRDINKTYCEIRYYNLRELKEIRKYLNNISIIKNIKLKKISYKVNYYDILYYGNDNNLINLFKLNKLNLKFNNNICKISLK